MSMNIVFDNTISEMAFRRVRSRVGRVHPDAHWRKDGSALRSYLQPEGDLPALVQALRVAVLDALGAEAATVQVSIRASRGHRSDPFHVGTIGTPTVVPETYELG